jgi:iron complex outermembrane receptor protein
MISFPAPHASTAFGVALLGTASAFALAALSSSALAAAAAAPTAAAAPVEEVLITGSLIRGAEAVGVPVSAVGSEEFRTTGALTISDVLRSVPSVQVEASTSIANAGGQINRSIAIDVHTLNSTSSPRTLLLVDSIRVPPAGHGTDRFDPSIIPQLAVERVDVLADGASATYGSDAIAGVVNVILRRRYDGAMTQLRYGAATDGGAGRALFSQLYGTTWGSGDVTMTYEWYDEKGIPGAARPNQFAFDYTRWGLDNRLLVSYAVPPVYSIGAPNGGALISACTNCFSLPRGIGFNYGDTAGHTNPLNPGSATTTGWTAILGNPGSRQNQIEPYVFSDVLAFQQRNAATITFDQTILPGVELWGEGFYQNRRVQQRYPVLANPVRNASNIRGFTVPTNNPYYPSGAPAGIRVSYNISQELPPKLTADEVTDRWAVGFNLDLPFDWNGRVYYAFNEEKNIAIVQNIANPNNTLAALGNTVASIAASGSIPGQAAFTKPANIPFLNVFCDPFIYQCNSPATLAYLSSYRDYHQHYNLTEWGATFDGSLFALPGGDVRAAIGGNKYSYRNSFLLTQNFGPTYSTAIIGRELDTDKEGVWAVYGQVNVPVVGEMNALPFLRSLEFEGSLRYDKYDDFGHTTNPKIGVNLSPIDGLTLRGAWGTSFRAPAFADASSVSGAQIQAVNQLAGAQNVAAVCLAGETTPPAGSSAAALVAFYSPNNQTCAGFAAVVGSQFPGGLTPRGGAGIASISRGGTLLTPEEAKSYSIGGQYRPMEGFLQGLDVELTYFHVKVDKLLQALDVSADTLRNPALNFQVILPTDPNFASYVAAYVRHPRAEVITESQVRFIVDAAVRNTGFVQTDGFDFNLGYDWDIGNTGVVNAGIAGTYFLHRETQTIAGAASTQAYEGQSSACLFCAPPVPPRLRYRGNLGWSSMDGAWNINAFATYTSHYFATVLPLPPNAPADFNNLIPAHVTVDMSFGYNTGTNAVNDYLDNLDIRLVVNNIMNKYPPFMYKVTTGGSNQAAFDISQSPVGRMVTLVLTKTW